MFKIFKKVKFILGNRFYIVYLLILNYFLTRVLDLIGIAAIVAICTSFISNKASEKLSLFNNLSYLSSQLRLLLIFSIIF